MKISAFLIAASVASTSGFAPVSRAPATTDLKASFFDNLVKKPEPEPEPVVEVKQSFFDSIINSSKTTAKVAAKPAVKPAAKKAAAKAAPTRSFNLFAKDSGAKPADEKKRFESPVKFSTIANLDLWAPVSDSNDYGGRKKKNVKTGTLTSKSYVPTGMTKEQYEKIRGDADKKKAKNYQRNVAKAGVFEDYTEFYTKRGSGENGSFMKLPNLGHRMAKTKYDWSLSGSENRETIEDNGNGKR